MLWRSKARGRPLAEPPLPPPSRPSRRGPPPPAAPPRPWDVRVLDSTGIVGRLLLFVLGSRPVDGRFFGAVHPFRQEMPGNRTQISKRLARVSPEVVWRRNMGVFFLCTTGPMAIFDPIFGPRNEDGEVLRSSGPKIEDGEGFFVPRVGRTKVARRGIFILRVRRTKKGGFRV